MGNLKALYRRLLIIVTTALTVLTIFVSSSISAQSNNSATFTWRANQPEEFIVGYRLYFDTQSRYNNDGTLKNNFSYGQYIDFTDQTLCSGSAYSSCVNLSSTDLQCINYFSETPSCKVYNLKGTLYFTMTAYNNTSESGYTSEIVFNSISNPADLLPIIEMLLLND